MSKINFISIFTLASAVVAFSGLAMAQSPDGPYKIGFYVGANEGLPDAQVHILNPGSTGGFGNPTETPTATPQGGDLCANIYVFLPDEEMIACCSCKISPNGMQGFSLATDLTSPTTVTLTGTVAHAGALKVVASQGGGTPAGLATPPSGPTPPVATAVSGVACDAGSFYPVGGVLEAYTTHVRTLGSSIGVTETALETAPLSVSEYTKLTQQCFAIEKSASQGGVGSGAGICKCDPNKAF